MSHASIRRTTQQAPVLGNTGGPQAHSPTAAAPFAAWGAPACRDEYRPSTRARARRLLRMLAWSLAAVLTSLMIVVALFHLDDPAAMPALRTAALSALAASGLAYCVVLGMLADHLGRNWILWVALTVLTKPFGPFIAYLLMRDSVKYVPRPPFRTSHHCMRCGTLVTAGARLCSACGNPTTAGFAESQRADVVPVTRGPDLRQRRSSATTDRTRDRPQAG